MRRVYAAMIEGTTGRVKTLTRLWSSRFTGIRARILIPEEHEKLELKVEWNAGIADHIITLTRTNWRTGESAKLFFSTLHKDCTQPRNKKD